MKSLYGSITRSAVSCLLYVSFVMVFVPPSFAADSFVEARQPGRRSRRGCVATHSRRAGGLAVAVQPDPPPNAIPFGLCCRIALSSDSGRGSPIPLLATSNDGNTRCHRLEFLRLEGARSSRRSVYRTFAQFILSEVFITCGAIQWHSARGCGHVHANSGSSRWERGCRSGSR